MNIPVLMESLAVNEVDFGLLYDKTFPGLTSPTLLLACLMGQYCFARCRFRLLSVVVCSTAGGPDTRAVRRPTVHGGPVVLCPVRATPCLK